jgi:hypothetical protein
LVLHPKTLAEVLGSILAIGSAAGAVEAAKGLIGQLQQRLAAVAERVSLVCPAAAAAVAASCTVSGYRVSGLGLENAVVCESGSSHSSSSSSHGSGKPVSQQQPQQSSGKRPQQQDCTPPPPPPPPPQQQQQQQQQQGVWKEPPRVLSLEGLNPLVLGGQWLPDVKAAAGAIDASGQRPGDNPSRITWQQVGCPQDLVFYFKSSKTQT